MLDDIYKIELSSFADPWSRDSILSALSALDGDSVLCHALLYDGMPAGFSILVCAADESELLNIAVDNKYRRRGFASALLENAELSAVSCGASVMYLEVRESNEAAKSLYKKHGFNTVGKRKNYYRRPSEDAVVMAKVLNKSEK